MQRSTDKLNTHCTALLNQRSWHRESPNIQCYLWRFKLFKAPILRRIIRINKIIPIIMNTEPLIVHEGLLYINELVGPTIDLDCAVKIKPKMTNNTPIMVTQILNNHEML